MYVQDMTVTFFCTNKMVHNSSSFQCFLYDKHKDHKRNTYISLKFSTEVETEKIRTGPKFGQ